MTLSSTPMYSHQISCTLLTSYALLCTLINSHVLSSTLMHSHHLSYTLINSNALTSALMNSHQLSCMHSYQLSCMHSQELSRPLVTDSRALSQLLCAVIGNPTKHFISTSLRFRQPSRVLIIFHTLTNLAIYCHKHFIRFHSDFHRHFTLVDT